MEHIEEAGVHSGDSACAIPPYSLPGPVVKELRDATEAMARELGVVGLMNVQFAVKWEVEERGARSEERGKKGENLDPQSSSLAPRPVVYVIEVNPRASRTVPFVAKATGNASRQNRRQGDGRRVARRTRYHGRSRYRATSR